MKLFHSPTTTLFHGLFAGLILTFTVNLTADEPNTLTGQEREEGWRLLFDGKSLNGWRGFKKESAPDRGWVVQDGCLMHVARGGGGDLITQDQFMDYEFTFEWKIAARGNSGVKYFITEKRNGAIGHEYQVLDDDAHPDGRAGGHRQTGALYDVLPVDGNKKMNPVGEFNHSKIVVHGKHIEHWLNGQKVLEYELGSDRLQEAIEKSKFKDIADFGTKYAHHILLQDHQDPVWYRNLKIRELK